MWVTVNWLAEVTGKHPATIKKRIANLERDKDGKVDSGKALEFIYVGGGGTVEEVIKQLNIKRTQEIDLGMEITRKDRIPIEDCNTAHDEVFQSIAGTLKANRGKALSEDLINEMLGQFREAGDRITRDE